VVDRVDALAITLSGPEGDAAAAVHGRLTLDGLGRFAGGCEWVERRLFEVLGAWSPTEAVPEAQLMFDVYSQQHAWHAELFAERLPVLDSVDPATLKVAPSAEVDRMLSMLSGGAPAAAGGSVPTTTTTAGAANASASGGTLLRLVGLGRVVLPRLVIGHALALRRTSAVSEAPLHRSLRLVLRDETEEWQAVEALVQTLLRRPHDVAVVTAHQEQLEQLVAGGGAGLVPWPTPPATA
jgi:hypothetical protein